MNKDVISKLLGSLPDLSVRSNTDATHMRNNPKRSIREIFSIKEIALLNELM